MDDEGSPGMWDLQTPCLPTLAVTPALSPIPAPLPELCGGGDGCSPSRWRSPIPKLSLERELDVEEKLLSPRCKKPLSG